MRYDTVLWRFAPMAVIVTGVCALVYVAVHQNYRQSLNDPQVQIAEDAARALQSGAATESVILRGQVVDIRESLATWNAVFDDTGANIGASGRLGGENLKIPQGALEAAKRNAGKDTNIKGQNRITWQPEKGVRSALVIQYFSGPRFNGYVVAGRNMREIEDRESQLAVTVFLAWLTIIALGFFTEMVVVSYRR